ncbi:hypothetical protein MMC14_002519 [Varicellaria rhodocarpa]|nr:hypothetical protein [Varicellaria rhodocarpa]
MVVVSKVARSAPGGGGKTGEKERGEQMVAEEEEKKKKSKEAQRILWKPAKFRAEFGEVTSDDMINSNEEAEMQSDDRPGQ